ncbi:hypothetical protein HDU90_006764 [Geranomyces variabilis]|nr:hypothetical protein HDU90_006764 [Geranomyces variabilis]
MKVLIYVPPPHALSCYKRIIDMTGFRCPLILAPTPALDDIVINGTMSPDEINSMLRHLCIPEILRSQYKVVTSHDLNENNAVTTVDLLMKLHILSGGFSWEDYGDLANVGQTRKVCYKPDPEKNEWDGSLLDILLICNIEKGRRVLQAIVILNRTG